MTQQDKITEQIKNNPHLKKMNNIRTEVQAASNWLELLFISIILTALAYGLIDTPLSFVFCVAACICWLFCIKNLIVEANVKALEIFYGKKRQIGK